MPAYRRQRLEGLGQGYLLTAKMACKHRAAGNQDGRNVQTSGSHQHAGHDLVAVRDEHQTVQLVRLRQRLYAVRDQLTACQRVLHADVTHGNAVAYADGIDFKRHAACHIDAGLYGFGNLVQVVVPGDDIAFGAKDRDERTVHFLIGESVCLKELRWGLGPNR